MMESNTYKDPSRKKVITNGDLNKMVWRSLLLQASFNYERMQACGWLYGLLPGLKKIHKNKEDLSKSMKDHMEFFNTHPFLVNFIMGLILAMEENKEDRNTIRAVKVATMGPLGGIGDALFWLTALPICVGIGASIAMEGNIAGPFVFLILFNALHFFLRFFLMKYGYNTGVNAIATLKEQTKKISHAASIVGLTVVGGLIASMVKLKTTMVIAVGSAVGDSAVKVQEGVLDAVMPNMLALGYTLLMYKLLKKGYSPVKLITITVIMGIVAKAIQQFTGFAIL
ncbi:PTS system, mannose/fructose/sorbose-family IID component [Clostridium neonatale]|uniref:PTS system, mannose/fructose/sorbose-family IID component n=3 Tax=Clostridium TaxID=1485 RepID=A0AA86MM95_9CLOT|nr:MULTISPECIES: PTS system mannose/fructose/sorbose family transporter subunit IID [Clostridium]CAG9703408.1 PTS system, mannose/fructose/sorbose-family IID component [Clostridium neonatale]CAG9710422.1 PTS system, mannose/fructose/sorbose-family IID component [Clostridium neonatale]CAG9710747.1 PTS system, mannose/fructose/sorbose-family IID component [Clostridium neonatale]CAH0435051.1 PTS system, mannose/fructose/sorbose-family IID component [Clostridium neonatale]CAI3240609.1 PTS system, 